MTVSILVCGRSRFPVRAVRGVLCVPTFSGINVVVGKVRVVKLVAYPKVYFFPPVVSWGGRGLESITITVLSSLLLWF